MARLKTHLKIDRFRKSRGGRSRWLLLSCEKCKAPLFGYQKDGPGMLKRLYLDRIVPSLPARLPKPFACSKCNTVLGVPTVYEKEQRPAIRLFVGAIEKKIGKGAQIDNWIGTRP